MTGRKIIEFALAHAYEEAEKDALTKNLTLALLNLGLSELTDAENKFRKQTALYNKTAYTPLAEPVFIYAIDDTVEYCYQITAVLLPLWLAWKVFEGMDDPNRAQYYRSLYDAKYNEIVPYVAEFVLMRDNAAGQIDAEDCE